jgi:hypothetical protein
LLERKHLPGHRDINQHHALHTRCPQVVLAAVIIALVATKLDDVQWENGELTATKATCALGSSFNSASLCVYTYIVAAVSIGVGLVLALLMCATCNLCGVGKHLNVFVAALGTVWWAIAGALVQKNLNSASTAASVVSIMIWIQAGLFGAMLVAAIFWACGCCRSREYESMA